MYDHWFEVGLLFLPTYIVNAWSTMEHVLLCSLEHIFYMLPEHILLCSLELSTLTSTPRPGGREGHEAGDDPGQRARPPYCDPYCDPNPNLDPNLNP